MRRRTGALALVLLVACTHPAHEPAPSPSLSLSPTASPTISAEVADIAYATADRVVLRGRTGATRVLGTLTSDEEVVGLDWSPGAEYVEWLTVSPRGAAVFAYEVASGRTGGRGLSVPAYDHASLGSTAVGLVVVGSDRRMVVLHPGEMLHEGPMPNISITGAEGTTRLLVANRRRILVATDEGASAAGGPETVYDVAVGGHATRLFTDGDGEPEGEVRNLPMSPAALTADGTRLVYQAGATAGHAHACEDAVFTAVRDLVARREVRVPSPALPGARLVVAASIATGADGTTYEAVRTADGCGQQPRSALFELSGNRWEKVEDDARWGAASAEGRLAVIRTSGDLAVGGTVVAHGVTFAAWAPLYW